MDYLEPCSVSFYLVGDQIEICLCYRRPDGSTYGHTEFIDLTGPAKQFAREEMSQ